MSRAKYVSTYMKMQIILYLIRFLNRHLKSIFLINIILKN